MTDAARTTCPHPDDLESLVEGTLSDPVIELEIAEHLDHCLRCRRYVDDVAGWESLAGRFRELDSSPGPSVDSTSSHSKRRGGVVGLFILLAVVCTGLAVLATVPQPQPPPDVPLRPTHVADHDNSQPSAHDPHPSVGPLATAAFAVIRDDIPISGHTELQHAIDAAATGDVVEIRRNLPFYIRTITIERDVTIRAAPGSQPALLPAETVGDPKPLFICRANLTLDGVTLVTRPEPRRPRNQKSAVLVRVDNGTLRLHHCDIDLKSRGFEDTAVRAPQSGVEIVDCRIRGGVAVDTGSSRPGHVRLTGSVLHGAMPLLLRHGRESPPMGALVSIDRCTIISECAITILFDDQLRMNEPGATIGLSMDRSVVVARDSLIRLSRIDQTNRSGTLEQQIGDTLQTHVAWTSSDCVFAVEQRYASWQMNRLPVRPNLPLDIARISSQPRIATLAVVCQRSGAFDVGSCEVDFPVDAPMFGPITLADLETLQDAILLHAELSTGTALNDRGAPDTAGRAAR